MIDKLEMFLALAREEHFGRAAQACGVSQPSLSAAIKQLEDQLGVMLVARGSRFRGLTPEGDRVREWASRIVADAHAMRDEMRAVRQGLSGNLRIAVIPTALPFAARLTAQFAALHPNVRTTVLSRTATDILTMLDRYEADAGITYTSEDGTGRLHQVALFQEDYALLVHPKTVLPRRHVLGWKDLRDMPLALLTQDMQNRRLIARHLSDAGADNSPVVESNSMLFLLARVQAGDCAAVLPRDLAESMRADLAVIPIAPDASPHRVGIVTQGRAETSPILTALQRTAVQMFDS